jgi:hypothetical protein
MKKLTAITALSSLDPTKDMIGDLPPIKEVPASLFATSEFDSRHCSASSAAGFLEAIAEISFENLTPRNEVRLRFDHGI